ncbi:MAG: DUF4406 domain-containing protein [Pseudomonadota bacterium]
MWIMIAGPYRGGSKDEVHWGSNHRKLNQVALAILEKGHVPIIGVNLALPIIEVAGQERYQEIMMPLSLAAAERCDACLRFGGLSGGADREEEFFSGRGLPVYRSLDEVPYGG